MESIKQEVSINPEQRFYDDSTTWLAEMLDGNMRTSFNFRFDGHELYSRDGGALEPVFEDALEDATEILKKHPNLKFETRRRYAELEEYKLMLDMAKDNLPNTMVVVSDFPEELMDSSEDVGGYNVTRKQTMLRVITKNSEGSIQVRSQSLDQSNRQALEEIYESLGFKAEEGELLRQRMHLELDSENQATFTDQLTGVYDRSLNAQFGGEWYAGRQPKDKTNTFDFVRLQEDLVGLYMDASRESNEQVLYSIAATMQARFKRVINMPDVNTAKLTQLFGLREEIRFATIEAIKANKTYSGCGLSLGRSGASEQSEINEAGYGNKTSETSNYDFDKKMFCVVCQEPPKEGENKKMCGPCGICRSCDTKLKER